MNCPCCGQQTVVRGGIFVDLRTNTIVMPKQNVRVGRRLAELAHILVAAMPDFARNETIISGMHGATPTEWADTDLKVAVCGLRRAVAGCARIRNFRGQGYSIELVEGTNVTNLSSK